MEFRSVLLQEQGIGGEEQPITFAANLLSYRDNKKAGVYMLGSNVDSLAGEYESEKAAYKILRRLEEDFGEQEVTIMVALNSLPTSWEQFKISFCHTERSLNMRTLRHHLLMEEDRKHSQGKERKAQHAELYLGEERNNGNKNLHKKNNGQDLRDKINKKRGRDDRGGRNSYHKVNKRDFKCHNCGELGHFRAECTKKRRTNEKRNAD